MTALQKIQQIAAELERDGWQKVFCFHSKKTQEARLMMRCEHGPLLCVLPDSLDYK